MFCKHCGAQLNDEDLFCAHCGTPSAAPDDQVPVQPTVSTEPIITPADPSSDLPNDSIDSFDAPVMEVPTQEPVAAATSEEAVVQSSASYQPDSPVATIEATPRKSKKGLIIGIVAALAAVLLIGGIWLGYLHFAGNESDDASPSDPTALTPPSSTPETPEPDTDTVTLVVEGAQLTYELTDTDVEKFYELLDQCKEKALAGEDPDTVMNISDELDDQFEYMDSQLSIATVLYYCDLNDEEASQLYLDCTNQITEANNAYLEMAKELYDTEFPAKERFFEEWTEQDLLMLMAYTPEVMELRQRNSEIEVAYQDLQDDEEMYTKMVPLYIEMVQNNNRMAQIFGYSNYYEYAYELIYTRDYGPEEIGTMRTLAAQYLPDTLEAALNNFITDMEDLNYFQQMNLSGFLFDSYEDDYTDEIEAYLATLPEQTRSDMLDMFNGNILMLDGVDSAMEGAFTTAISPNRYICYFGPGYSSPLTIIHEVGHYYGAKHTYLNDLPLDLAETQSQGNEWLFMSFMENEMQTALYNSVVDYKLYSDLATIMLCVIIDEFEEQVYTHPNIAGLTSDDLDAIMAEVCESYGGIDFIGETVTDIQSYWRMVVVEQPVYYISYGVSAIAAINIFTVAAEDYEQAVEIYCSLIEDVDLEEGFLGNIGNAKLDGPFDEDVYIKLQALTK